ncbi:hypothetical protein Scep_026011 [Stephania cephalantha]|uniref:Uncharacterized protein n=1 Tax=Stephania cephalantha TaxID=152367 RepID=A0AAP0HRP3_9MAGN
MITSAACAYVSVQHYVLCDRYGETQKGRVNMSKESHPDLGDADDEDIGTSSVGEKGILAVGRKGLLEVSVTDADDEIRNRHGLIVIWDTTLKGALSFHDIALYHGPMKFMDIFEPHNLIRISHPFAENPEYAKVVHEEDENSLALDVALWFRCTLKVNLTVDDVFQMADKSLHSCQVLSMHTKVSPRLPLKAKDELHPLGMFFITAERKNDHLGSIRL